MAFNARMANQCMKRFTENSKRRTIIHLEACMGAGKALWPLDCEVLLTEHQVEHVIVLCRGSLSRRWRERNARRLGQLMGWIQDLTFHVKRRQPRQPGLIWTPRSRFIKRFAAKRHSTPSKCENGGVHLCSHLRRDSPYERNQLSWGDYVEQLQQMASYSVFMSGTTFA